jgi:predicted  nucleic acid-binding Zn-ribbon protein
MQERNKVTFKFNNNNRLYSISTSLTQDKINLVCVDPNSQIYENTFSLSELIKLSKYFQPTHSIEQIQLYLNSIIEKQKIGINQGVDALSFNLYLINNDQISIPLLKRLNLGFSYPYVRYSSMTQRNQVNPPNQIISQRQSQLYNKNMNNIQISPIQNQQKIIVQNKPVSASAGYIPNPRANINQPNVSNFSLDENKLNNLEKENQIIKSGQEKLKNDIKRLMQEITKLKEENQVYKTEHNSLKNENNLLKNENNNYKNQIVLYQKENDALKKQLESYNKDLDAVENQNDEIRKMYEELENEYNQYKAQTEEINKENELLREQIELLNNNFTMINKELENIRNENDIFKTNLEQQKQNLNEDMVNKLIEENNLLRKKLEENDNMKKQSGEIQEVSEDNKEREKEEENENQEEDEEKGEIIHNMKELELITDKINKENKKIIINLLYKASVDGDKASIFHEKCDKAKSTIVLVETLNGKRFGGFTTCSWAGNCEDKNDPQAFIFSLDKMKTYENIPGDEAIGCYPKFGPIFLGCQIKIFDNAFTKGGTTFEKELNFNTKEDFELTGGDRVFQIKDIEVYEVVIE